MPFLISKVNIPVSPDQEQDLVLTRHWGIRSLPAYMIQNGNKALFLQSFDIDDFVKAIDHFSLF